MEILPPNFETAEKRTYNWAEWLMVDNCPRILQRGEDFDETSQTIRKQLVAEAARAGLNITSKLLKGDRILYQIFTPDGSVPKLPEMLDAREKYPWGEWFDGEEHELRKGAHFKCEPGTFRAYVYKVARKRNLKVRLEWPFADVCKLQTYTPEER